MGFLSVLQRPLPLLTLGIFLQTACPTQLVAQSGSPALPPVKTYYVDKDNRRLGVAERWTEDESGLRHGTYLRYSKQGLVVEKATYVHGSKTGAGRKYEYSGNELWRGYSGNYRDGVQVGEWVGANRAGEAVEVSQYEDGGKLIKVTYYQDGQPVRVVQHQPVFASTATASVVAPSSFYHYLPAERAQFQALVYRTEGRKMTGAELAANGKLRDPAQLVYMVNQNNTGRHIELLLKQCKAMGLNPARMIMEDSTLQEFTLRQLSSLQSAQVDGELLYYGLRRSLLGNEMASGTLVTYFIRYRSRELPAYKRAMESHFYACARAARDPHADPRVYPLRRWLYEAYATSEPTSMMNALTQPTAQDAALYPNYLPR